MLTMFPQQEACCDFLVRSLLTRNGALNSSAVGTGKTLVAVEVARSLATQTYVVAPKSVLPGWERTFKEQGVPVVRVINYEMLRTGNTLVATKQGRTFKWNIPQGSLVVFDESHRTNVKTLNAALVISAFRSGMRVLLLSATPFETPAEMRTAGYVLGLHNLGNFYRWAMANGCYQDMWGSLKFDPAETPLLVDLNTTLYTDRACRLTREDLAGHFSQVSIDWTPLDFSDRGAIAKALQEVEGPLTALAERASLDGEDPIALVKILRARQRVELLKVPTIVDLVADSVLQGFSCFIALNFDASIDTLAEALATRLPNVTSVQIRGGQSASDREAAVQMFQSNRARICIANISAGGVGLNLHDTDGKFPRQAYVSPSFSAKELEQVLGRTDRVGAASDVLQRVLIAAGTIEERIFETLKQKISRNQLTNAPGALIEEAQAKANEIENNKNGITDMTAPAPSLLDLPVLPNVGVTTGFNVTPPLVGNNQPGDGAASTTSPDTPAVTRPPVSDAAPGTAGTSVFPNTPLLGTPAPPTTVSMSIGVPVSAEVTNTSGRSSDMLNVLVAPTSPTPLPTSTEQEPAHAKFSPSQLKYFRSCPGYLPDSTENEAAAKGTRIHAALETDNDTGLLDDSEHYLAAQCRLAVTAIRRRHHMPATDRSVKDIREIRVKITAGTEKTFGTCDRLFIKGPTGIMADYKTGMGAVDPVDCNLQAWAYVLGAFQQFPDLKTVHFYFIIPQRDEILYGKFDREFSSLVSGELERVLTAARNVDRCWKSGEVPVESLHVKESVCRFCARASKCPRFSGVAVEVVRRYAPEVQIPTITHGSQNDSPEEIAAMMNLIPALEKWAAGVREKARAMCNDGVEVPGYQLKKRTGTRKITSPLLAWNVANQLGVSLDEFMGAVKSIGVSDYEEVVGSKAPKGKKTKMIAETMASLFAVGGVEQSADSFVLSAIK